MTQEQSKSRWTVVTPRLAGHMALWLGIAACAALLVRDGVGISFILSVAGIVTGAASLISSRRSGAKVRLRVIGMLISAVPLGVIVALIIMRPPERGHRHVYCQINLKNIGGALREYERMREGMPGKIDDLIGSGLLPPGAFSCPFDSDWRNGQSSYFFFLSDKNNPDSLIGCDLKTHSGGRNVLTAPHNVFFLKHEEFNQRLAQPENAAFAAALRAFEASGAKHFPLDRPLAASRPCGDTAPMADRTSDKE
ncbi:MAG: hypothetical protein ABFD92_12160 [Planctomycetaceae bacterium]|nr:hypothetical protein [Planctomycetaceae bacterium]